MIADPCFNITNGTHAIVKTGQQIPVQLGEVISHPPTVGLRRRSRQPDCPGGATPSGRSPGRSVVILAAGLFLVSFTGQYSYVFAARHQSLPSMIESAMSDAGMIIFALLALGLAHAGNPPGPNGR